jgi:NADH-ubiquinone oxidoreductase chain 5
MVTAGVFLLIRCSPLFEYAPNALLLVTFVGAMTAFFAATVGLVQSDLKKVIAYSTCSQLGYMVFACGLSNYHVGLFHLANHAFFKALLFLSAGCVIHALGDEQDMRKMGGLLRLLPYTYAMMMIGSLSLMGFPFLTGFYSKDVILELAFANYTMAGSFAHWLGTLAAVFTAFYSFRLLVLTFMGTPNGFRTVFGGNVHDAPKWMGLPLLPLAFGSVFIGYLTRDMIIGLGTPFWGNAIFIHPDHVTIIDSEFIPAFVKNLPVCGSLLGAGFALVGYHTIPAFFFRLKTMAGTGPLGSIGNQLYNFLVQKWFFDKVYNEFVAHRLMGFGYHTSFKLLDKGLFEMLGPYGISNSVSWMSARMSSIQTGLLPHYALVMLLGITALLVSGTFGASAAILPSVEPALGFILVVLVGIFA